MADDLRQRLEEMLAAGPFRADWESLRTYRTPQWFENAKFGISVHWGVYSVPAFVSEWYPYEMYVEGTEEFRHHVETYGDHQAFGYKDFVPRLTGDAFDPDRWAELFRRSGAQYVVPVAEHHDGFAMYDSELSAWTAVKMGPKRDVIGDLSRAVRRQWLAFGVSSHRAHHWWYYHPGMGFASDVRQGRFADLYGPAQPRGLPPNEAFLDDWLLRLVELVERYQPQIVWFDDIIEQPVYEPYLREFAAYYYNSAKIWQRTVVITYKHDAFSRGSGVHNIEREHSSGIRTPYWQMNTGLSKNSWGYVVPQQYKSVDDIIGDLADVVSKGGGLLLNVGPKADGTIPEREEEILLAIGQWLYRSGEAIFGTRPWHTFGEGPTAVVTGPDNDTNRPAFTSKDIRFTCRGDTVYAIVMKVPARGVVQIRSLAQSLAPGATVELLGCSGTLSFSAGRDALMVSLPGDAPPPEGPFALKIGPTLSGQ
jgi:alpha-L-fucosidase